MTDDLAIGQRLRVYAATAPVVVLTLPADQARDLADVLDLQGPIDRQAEAVMIRVAEVRHRVDVLQGELLLRARWFWVASALVWLGVVLA